jgi:hypothetical protein
MCLLVIIPNDVWVVICILEKAHLAICEGNEVSQETFDSHCTALQGTHIDHSAM